MNLMRLMSVLVIMGSVTNVDHAQTAPRSGSKKAVAKTGSGISGGVPSSKLGTVGGSVTKGAKIDGTGMKRKR